MELMAVHGFANPNRDQAKFNADLHDELLRHQTVKQSCYYAAWAGGCRASQPECMDDSMEHAVSVALGGMLRYFGKKMESENGEEELEEEMPARQKSEVCFHDIILGHCGMLTLGAMKKVYGRPLIAGLELGA